jgi:hypothetical protein
MKAGRNGGTRKPKKQATSLLPKFLRAGQKQKLNIANNSLDQNRDKKKEIQQRLLPKRISEYTYSIYNVFHRVLAPSLQEIGDMELWLSLTMIHK